jgi:hypothetical protein
MSVFRVEIKLRVTPSDILKVDFAATLSQVLTHTRTLSHGGGQSLSLLPYEYRSKMILKIF